MNTSQSVPMINMIRSYQAPILLGSLTILLAQLIATLISSVRRSVKKNVKKWTLKEQQVQLVKRKWNNEPLKSSVLISHLGIWEMDGIYKEPLFKVLCLSFIHSHSHSRE